MSHTLHKALESGQEVRIGQIDFSASFDRAVVGILSSGNSRQALLCGYWRFSAVCFDTVSLQWVARRLNLFNAVLGVPQGSVLGLLLFFQ